MVYKRANFVSVLFLNQCYIFLFPFLRNTREASARKFALGENHDFAMKSLFTGYELRSLILLDVVYTFIFFIAIAPVYQNEKNPSR